MIRRVVALAFRGTTTDVVSVWTYGTLRTDPCEACKGSAELLALATHSLSAGSDEVAHLPLSRIEAGRASNG
jgi:hypothetical protein